mmetsp:Transcript_18212/g.56886  ORF Transcript_18212/g.56886 Transcript_18212/m.56886 type:complete len:106 (-) Transcript_18212:1144-1461(-)
MDSKAYIHLEEVPLYFLSRWWRHVNFDDFAVGISFASDDAQRVDELAVLSNHVNAIFSFKFGHVVCAENLQDHCRQIDTRRRKPKETVDRFRSIIRQGSECTHGT